MTNDFYFFSFSVFDYSDITSFAETVKAKVDNARLAKEQHSYMYWGGILDSLIDDLEHLTHSVIAFKR